MGDNHHEYHDPTSADDDSPADDVLVTVVIRRTVILTPCDEHGLEPSTGYAAEILANPKHVGTGLPTRGIIAGVGYLLARLHEEGITYAIEGEVEKPSMIVATPVVPQGRPN